MLGARYCSRNELYECGKSVGAMEDLIDLMYSDICCNIWMPSSRRCCYVMRTLRAFQYSAPLAPSTPPLSVNSVVRRPQ